jgi:hypothetical protein
LLHAFTTLWLTMIRLHTICQSLLHCQSGMLNL